MTFFQDNPETFVRLLAGSQLKIFSFILQRTGNRGVATRVLQAANVSIWRHADEVASADEFLTFAKTTALKKLLIHRDEIEPSAHFLSEQVLKSLSEEELGCCEEIDEYAFYLATCTTRLSEKHDRIMKDRYELELAVDEIAVRNSRTVKEVTRTLHKVRSALFECIEHELKTASKDLASGESEESFDDAEAQDSAGETT